MKTLSRILSLLIVLTMTLSMFAGCNLVGDDEDEVAALVENIDEAIAEAGSVEASIFLDLQAHIGTSGTTGSHTASVESDISVVSTFAPYAYHAETFSRILVDGVSTREDTETYAVPAENGIDHYQYNYKAEDDTWTRQVLTLADAKALPLKTCLMHNWEAFLNTARIDSEGVDCNGKIADVYSGTVDSSVLQEIMNDGIFGSFLYSVEQLLNDELSCTLYLEQETYLPVQLVIDFKEAFSVSDMFFDSANITVDYTDWGKTSEISVPKKVSVVAADLQDEFYASYFAWNLFLPFLQAASDTGSGESGGNQNFTTSWETFQVRIDNGVTALPILYTDLANLGYTIDDFYKNIIIEPNMYVEQIPVFKGQDLIYCAFYNDGTEAMPISSCKIGSLDFAAANQQYNGISIFLPGNVCLGVTKDYVISTFGNAHETTQSFSADTYVWRVAETENQFLLIEVNPTTSEVIRLQLTYIPVTGGKQ